MDLKVLAEGEEDLEEGLFTTVESLNRAEARAMLQQEQGQQADVDVDEDSEEESDSDSDNGVHPPQGNVNFFGFRQSECGWLGFERC